MNQINYCSTVEICKVYLDNPFHDEYYTIYRSDKKPDSALERLQSLKMIKLESADQALKIKNVSQEIFDRYDKKMNSICGKIRTFYHFVLEKVFGYTNLRKANYLALQTLNTELQQNIEKVVPEFEEAAKKAVESADGQIKQVIHDINQLEKEFENAKKEYERLAKEETVEKDIAVAAWSSANKVVGMAENAFKQSEKVVKETELAKISAKETMRNRARKTRNDAINLRERAEKVKEKALEIRGKAHILTTKAIEAEQRKEVNTAARVIKSAAEEVTKAKMHLENDEPKEAARRKKAGEVLMSIEVIIKNVERHKAQANAVVLKTTEEVTMSKAKEVEKKADEIKREAEELKKIARSLLERPYYKEMKLIKKSYLTNSYQELERLREKGVLTKEIEDELNAILFKFEGKRGGFINKSLVKVNIARALEIKKLFKDYYVFISSQENKWAFTTCLIKELVRKNYASESIKAFKFLRTPKEKKADIGEIKKKVNEDSDHDSLLREELISASLRFLDSTKCESALYFVSNNYNVSKNNDTINDQIIRKFLVDEKKISKLNEHMKVYNMINSNLGTLQVFCIPEYLVDSPDTDPQYRSHSYGIECQCHTEHKKVLDTLRQEKMVEDLHKCDWVKKFEPKLIFFSEKQSPQFRLVASRLDPNDGTCIFTLSPVPKGLRREFKEGVRKIIDG